MITKIIILAVLIVATIFCGWMEEQEPSGGFISLPGPWGFLCAGLALSTVIVLIVFGILWIAG